MTRRADSRSRSETIFVTEVYSAIQGEGANVGERQVFVRLSGCNIRCSYCDQPEALELRAGPCRIEQTPGRRDWLEEESPLPIGRVAKAVDHLSSSLVHHSVSITGGEPLLQADRLVALVQLLSAAGHSISLETNGMLAARLSRVASWIDHVSMDIKLDSVDGQGIALDAHRRFLRSSVGHDVAVKIVLGPSTDLAELEEAVTMIHEEAPGTEVFLQPVTPFGTVTRAPTPSQVLELQSAALQIHPRVRVVPQTHKAIGQL